MSHIISLTYRLGFLFLLLLFAERLQAQQNNTLYFMNGIPQSNQLNPAIQPNCGFYFAMPVLSSLEFNAGNTAVGFNDVFLFKSSTDSLYYKPVQSEKDKSDFLGKLKKNNYVFSDLRLDWLSFGFRINENYISFSAADRAEVRGNIPHDLFDLGLSLNMSNAGGKAFNFNGLGFNATWFREYALGLSRELNEMITFGIRGKLLFGKANINSSGIQLSFPQTGMDLWKTSAAIDIKSSVPNLQIGYDNKGNVSIDSFKMSKVDGWKDAKPIVFNNKNYGAAIDLGILLKPEKMLEFSASIVDLGFIQWRSHVNNFSTGGNYDFKGFPVVLSDTSDMGQALIDSLKSVYSISASHENYTTTLSGKLYLGAHLQLIKSVGVGFLTRFQLLDKEIRPQYTFSLNLTPARSFAASFSYTIADGMYDNLGVGLSFKAGPFQWYLMSERIPLYYNSTSAGYPIPIYARNANFKMGFNLIFGSVRHRNIYKDKPLVEIED